jgi:hypothetical protein
LSERVAISGHNRLIADVFRFWRKLGLKIMFIGLEAVDEEGLRRFRKRVGMEANFDGFDHPVKVPGRPGFVYQRPSAGSEFKNCAMRAGSRLRATSERRADGTTAGAMRAARFPLTAPSIPRGVEEDQDARARRGYPGPWRANGMPKMMGGCLCGGVRYEGEAEPIFMRACHCKECQRFTGTAFATVIAVPKEAIRFTGTLKTYTQAGGTSGLPLHRRFCPGCGSAITVEVEGSERMVIMAGTLDDTACVRPTTNIFCEEAQAWVPMSSEMESFPRYDGWLPTPT